jgi:hypothetical protein
MNITLDKESENYVPRDPRYSFFSQPTTSLNKFLTRSIDGADNGLLSIPTIAPF